MSEPSRLLDRGASDDELRLLLAGAAEEPPADGLAKLAASLNVVLAPTMASGAKLGARSPWRSLTSKLAAKWVAVTVATTAVVAGALLAHRASSQHGVERNDATPDAVHARTAETLADDTYDVAHGAAHSGSTTRSTSPTVQDAVIAGGATPQNGAATPQNGAATTAASSQNGAATTAASSQNGAATTAASSQNGAATTAASSQNGRGANAAVPARATTLAERTSRAKGTASASAEPTVTGVSSTTPSVPTEARHEEPSATKSIAGEIAALDGVRARLSGSDAEGALRAIDDYRRDYPEGALGQEAALLRIDALVASGNIARARSAAERFLRDHPGTPHEKRLRTLIGGS